MGLSWPAAQEDVPTTVGLLLGAAWSLLRARVVRNKGIVLAYFLRCPAAAADDFSILLAAG